MTDLIRREDALKLFPDSPRPWPAHAIRAIIRAIPTVQPDAREAALREAASYHEGMAYDEDALSKKYRGGSNPWFAHVQKANWHREHASAMLALIDKPAVQPDREYVAFTMWKAEAARSAPNVGKHRTPRGFAEASNQDRTKWLMLADAAIFALKGETP